MCCAIAFIIDRSVDYFYDWTGNQWVDKIAQNCQI